jgi:hypothetical protein
MEIAAVSGTEPSPEQFLRQRGKTRSREKGIVYDPANQSLKIRRIKKIERSSKLSARGIYTGDNTNIWRFAEANSNTEYMSCELPSSNIINVFAIKNSTGGEAVTRGREEDDNIFIGRLNLERLGILDQLSRKFGLLKTLYIVKSNLPTE